MMEELLKRYYAYQKKIQLASSVRNVVANDQNNRMPHAAHVTRAQQLSYINGHIYELSNDPEYIALVRELLKYPSLLSPKDLRSLSLVSVAEESKHSKLFREEFDVLKSESLATRHKAKEVDNRSQLAPVLEKTFDKAREYARLYNPAMDAFSVWCDYSEFTMNAEKYVSLFQPLAAVSREILASTAKKTKNTDYLIQEYDEHSLLDLLHELLGTIGFDFKQGVISVIKRPYSENCGPYDERIHVGKGKGLLETILAGMHECGHGLTDMHINPEYHRTNIHRSVSMGIHESQARGLENMIGRSKPFCVYLTTLLEKYFPGLRQRNPDDVYQYLNYHEATTNRVAADEVTYNLHIIIRFEMEKAIFDGTLTMNEVPEARNEHYKKYLGVDVSSDKEGCLEDQHRSLGLFGYFPTYALGNIIAGQLRAEFTRVHPHRGDEIARGDFSSYFTRYKSNIRRHGNMYTTAELLKRVTGKDLSVDDFVGYLTQKYLGVY